MDGGPFVASKGTPYGAYVGISATLYKRIEDGTYPSGSRLPSEAELCGEFGVARGTIRRALSALQDQSLIQVVAGVGRFVRVPEEGEAGGSTGAQYQRIAAELRSRIETGEFGPGDVLPGELRISRRYGVSRYTAQRALTELERADLVMCVAGWGRIVGPKTSPDDPGASVDVR
jgi:DNA-binding GntR family transcriptional regulator